MDVRRWNVLASGLVEVWFTLEIDSTLRLPGIWILRIRLRDVSFVASYFPCLRINLVRRMRTGSIGIGLNYVRPWFRCTIWRCAIRSERIVGSKEVFDLIDRQIVSDVGGRIGRFLKQ